MKHAPVRTPLELNRGRAPARHQFAAGGVALALAAGLGTPALARTVARAWHLPFEAALIGAGFFVAVGFLVAGWAIGRQVDRLSEEARRDPVTRVGNRRLWEECLCREVERSAKAGMPLSLLLIDVDHLKRLNDGVGHHLGDEALGIVGDVLTATCRSRDVAARWGGDEFALLLPRTHAGEARVLAERIRAEITERREVVGGPLANLSVSIGICDLDSIAEPRAHLIVEAADHALYEAKRGGRDRVAVYERPRARSSVIQLDAHRARKSKRQTPSWA